MKACTPFVLNTLLISQDARYGMSLLHIQWHKIRKEKTAGYEDDIQYMCRIRVNRRSQVFKYFPSTCECVKRDTLSRKTLAIFAIFEYSGNIHEFPDDIATHARFGQVCASSPT